MIRLGIVGCGQWGQNYLRNFSDMPDRATIAAYADADAVRLAALQSHLPTARSSADAASVLTDPEIDAVIIATPSSTHAELVERALDSGKHVLVEKPFTLDPAEKFGASRMLVFDDLNSLEPVRIYDPGLSEIPSYRSFGEFQLVPRFGYITIPRIPMSEPLRRQCEHFLDCIEGRARPRSDGESGLRVARVLAALQQSLERDRQPVPLA